MYFMSILLKMQKKGKIFGTYCGLYNISEIVVSVLSQIVKESSMSKSILSEKTFFCETI